MKKYRSGAHASLLALALVVGFIIVSCAKGESASGTSANGGAGLGGSGNSGSGSTPSNSGGTPHGGATARAGSDAGGGPPVECEGGEVACGQACYDLATNPEHCGECSVVCPAEGNCQAGFCWCPGGATACGTDCVDLNTSPLHCGGCGIACGAGADCINGVCECFDATQTWCVGGCVNLNASNDHCLGCDQPCAEGEQCTTSGCDCAENWQRCDDVCVRIYDPNFCGDCDTQCESGEVCDATLGCIEGCPEPREACNGSCVLLDYDNANCGACENECDIENGFTCLLGECRCPDGYKECGGECVLFDDDRHCGACGAACAIGGYCESAGGDPACVCGTGKTVCDAAGSDPGFCVDLDTDEHNCGSCGNRCGADLECQNGVCECAAGLTVCGSGASAECVNTSIDTENCGACGRDCGLGTCVSGACECNPSATACGRICPDLNSDNNHCGACDNACSAPEVCRFGSCSECGADERECGGRCVAATFNERHCGACNNPCPAGSTCSGLGGTACACDNGKLLCDDQCLDLLNDDDNCGTNCNNAVACRAPEVCLDGVCGCANRGIVCDGECVDVQYSEQACGGCPGDGGEVCLANLTCIGGECTDAAIVVVNSDTIGKAQGTVSIPHSLETSAGNGRMVLVGLLGGGNNIGEREPTSITYDGAPLTQVAQAQPGNWVYAAIYYILDGDLPVGPGDYSLDITNPNGQAYIGNVVELMGVDQGPPLDFAVNAQSTCDGMTLTLDPGGADYTWAYNILTTVENPGSAVTRTESGGQTVIANPESQPGKYCCEGHAHIGLVGPISPPAPATLGWSSGGCWAFAHVGVLLSP